jgi:membrane associated rhomboid family serine protease
MHQVRVSVARPYAWITVRLANTGLRIPRLPWVTLALSLLCLCVFVAAQMRNPSVSADPFAKATEFWLAHAYLEPDPEILVRALAGVAPGDRREYLEIIRHDSYRNWSDDSETQSALQAELDRLTETALLSRDDTPQSPYTRWGLVPSAPRPAAFLTHLFLHAGWFHLLGNLALLIVVGTALEKRRGPAVFGGVFLLAGISSGGVSALVTAAPDLPIIGTSGAISGALAALVISHGLEEISLPYVFWESGRPLVRSVCLPVMWLVPTWLVHELLQAALFPASAGVAYWGAHIGGITCGLGAALVVREYAIWQKLPAAAADADQVVQQARAALQRGEPAEAFGLLRREISANRDHDGAILAFWDAAMGLDRPEAAAPCMLRLVKRCVERGEMHLAAQHWNTITKRLPDELAEPAALVPLASALVVLGQPERAVQALRQAIHPGNFGLTPELALQAVRSAKALDPTLAVEVARRALEIPEVSEVDRAHLRELTGDSEPEEPEAARRRTSSTPMGRFSGMKLVEAVPERFGERALLLRASNDNTIELPYDEVAALAAAVVLDVAEQPVVVTDLVLNGDELAEKALRVVRIRSDSFDPRVLVGDAGSIDQIYRRWLDELLDLTQAAPLPDLKSVCGEPLISFQDLASYEREILGVAR